MFKKLLANLSFNPSLINQLARYSKQLHQEVRLRRLGLLLFLACVELQLVPLLGLSHTYAVPVISLLVIVFILAAYAWLRAHQLTKELEVVRKEYGKGN